MTVFLQTIQVACVTLYSCMKKQVLVLLLMAACLYCPSQRPGYLRAIALLVAHR